MSGFANKGPQETAGASSYPTGPQLFDPSTAARGGGRSFTSTVVARAGGGRANATRLAYAVTRIATCATAADSVALPAAVGGQVIYLQNGGAAACQVFADPATSDTINGVAAATGISLAAGGKCSFVSPAVGVWFTILSA